MPKRNSSSVLLAAVGLTAVAGTSLAAGPKSASRQGGAKPAAKSMKAQPPLIGDVRIAGENVVMVAEQNARKGTLDFDLRGPRLVTVTTARYDLSAPRVTLSVRGGKVQTGTAAGGNVTVEVRSPEEQRTTTLRCSQADYVGARGDQPARLEMRGRVVSVLRDPQLAAPLETTALRGGTVVFLPDGTNRITLQGTTITGAIPDPPAPKR